jgi:polysaccharide pyruvyl transferase CsaB
MFFMKLLFSGYYGFGNEGDELVLSALLNALDDVRSEITVLSADPAATRARHRVRAADRWRPEQVFREQLRCDALISGGGGLLQDLSGPMTPGYYLGFIALARLIGKPAVLVGQGFGPVKRTWNPLLCRLVLPHATLIVPRDPQGLAWCRTQGVPDNKLVQGADPVWILPAPVRRAGRDWVVCLRADWLQHELPLWLNRLVQYARERNRRLRFVALGNRGDAELVQRIKAGLGSECDYAATPITPADELFAGAELVVSMRYHGLVLGARAGAAVTGFGPDEKIRYLLGELEQPEFNVRDFERHLDGILDTLLALQASAAHHAERLRVLAEIGLVSLRQVLGISAKRKVPE